MKSQIFYRIMFGDWIAMSQGYSHIVPCEYALVIDEQYTYISRSYYNVVRVKRRIRQYQGTIA